MTIPVTNAFTQLIEQRHGKWYKIIPRVRKISGCMCQTISNAYLLSMLMIYIQQSLDFSVTALERVLTGT
uniref:Transposase n=1 Tax=Romanomermis culicivorax TaxID=13658 RepID=A0A915J0B1_ROMCU